MDKTKVLKPEFEEVFDISVTLGEDTVIYPGDPPFEREVTSSIEHGEHSDVSRLSMSAHSGTHLDTPSHFVAGEKRLHEFDARDFIFPAQVIPIQDTEAIRVEEFSEADIHPGDAILFRTINSEKGLSEKRQFDSNYVYMTKEAADYCVEKKVSLVAVDSVSIDKYGDETYPAHHGLLGNKIFVLENVNLRDVPQGRFLLFCFPLKIRGGEASPVRAILTR